MLVAPSTQLWASLANLDEMGPTVESLASKSLLEKERALRAASGQLASPIRGRYTPPLAVYLEEFYTEGGLPLSSVALLGAAREALSLALRIDASGSVGDPLPVSWSPDGGHTWVEQGTLSAQGIISRARLTFAFSGALSAGGIVHVRAGVDAGIRQHVVNIAAYNLLYNRGVDSESADARVLKERHDLAIRWGEKVQEEKAYIAEEQDFTPNRREGRPRGGGQREAWDFIDDPRCRVRRRPL